MNQQLTEGALTNPNDNIKAHGKTIAPYLSSCDAKKPLSYSNRNWPRSDRWVVGHCGRQGAKRRQHILPIRPKELVDHFQITGLCGLAVGMPHTGRSTDKVGTAAHLGQVVQARSLRTDRTYRDCQWHPGDLLPCSSRPA
jgi:hypothetical protein